MMKVSKITLGLFSSGFLLYSLYKYFSQKKIPKEQISKIIKKITNLSVFFIFQKYDSQNKIMNQKKQFEDKKEEVKNNIKNDKTEEDFDNEIIYILHQIENEKIKPLKITREEFMDYILEYKDEDVVIEKNFNLIQKVLNSFKKKMLPEINFGFIIPEKYLEIISNIFYFNIKKAYISYYTKINNNNTKLEFKEKKELYNNTYNSYLKQTRNEICYFFGIDKDYNLEINVKLALKIFPFYFDINHNLRKKYIEMNSNVNKIMNIIIKSEYKIDVLTNENNVFFIKEPVDKILNFEDIINNINLKNDFSINDELLPYEDQFD